MNNGYRAYDLMTNEEVGRYATMHEAYEANPNRAITVIYRPSKRRAKAREFPYA